MKKYKDELIRSMKYLSKDKRTIFLGQSVEYSGNAIFNTLKDVDDKKKIELPVFGGCPDGLKHWFSSSRIYSNYLLSQI